MRRAGDLRERRRNGDHARTAHGQDPVQLGEAEVVADREAERDPGRGLGEDDLVTTVLGGRLAVLHAADDDVEHVDLAVDGSHLAVRSHVD